MSDDDLPEYAKRRLRERLTELCRERDALKATVASLVSAASDLLDVFDRYLPLIRVERDVRVDRLRKAISEARTGET